MREDGHGRVRVFWRSLGCKVNLADLGRAFSMLPSELFDFSAGLEEADVAVLNTCTVTHRADRDWRKVLSGWRRERPDLAVVVAGCATVRQEEALRRFPNVAGVARLGDDAALRDALWHFLQKRTGSREGQRQEGAVFPLGRHRAFVKIQDGCNARCSYCLVSRIRGQERSLAQADALRSVEQALDAGFGEVVLCGIHLGRYRDRDGRALPQLLRELGAVFGGRPGRRLRLSSIEPLEWSEELLRAIAGSEFVCRHFHVPIQSADDGVLARMGRPYTSEQALQTLRLLRRFFPDAALGTDVLAGFPGEDDAAFARTLAFVEEGGLDYWHAFAFSPRPGTPAAALPGRVGTTLIKQRVSRLRELGKRRWDDFLQQGIGQEHRVLVEESAGGLAWGRSGRYRRLGFAAAGARPGDLVRVTGTRLEDGRLAGSRVEARRELDGRREMVGEDLR